MSLNSKAFQAFIPDFLPSTFPGCSNYFVHASSPLPPIHSFELRFKRKMSQPFSEDWSDFAENLASSLPWSQLRECVAPKINSSLPTALQLDETKQMVTKPRAASVEHLEPVQRGQPQEPQRGSLGRRCLCVYVSAQKNFKLSTRKADLEASAGREHPVQLPTSPVRGTDSS